jgi:hypothetical protein
MEGETPMFNTDDSVSCSISTTSGPSADGGIGVRGADVIRLDDIFAGDFPLPSGGAKRDATDAELASHGANGGDGNPPGAGAEKASSGRKERNREHAKRSRLRKKFLLEGLQDEVKQLENENRLLRAAISRHLPKPIADELAESTRQGSALPEMITQQLKQLGGEQGSTTLLAPDFRLVQALATAQQNFVVTDPSLPENPIVFVSQNFLNLTQYSSEESKFKLIISHFHPPALQYIYTQHHNHHT